MNSEQSVFPTFEKNHVYNLFYYYTIKYMQKGRAYNFFGIIFSEKTYCYTFSLFIQN